MSKRNELVFEHEIDPSLDLENPAAKPKLDFIHASGLPPRPRC